MIYTSWLDNETWYHVVNDHGDCLIHTRSRQIAYFVNHVSRGIPRGQFLAIGGDRRDKKRPLLRHKR